MTASGAADDRARRLRRRALLLAIDAPPRPATAGGCTTSSAGSTSRCGSRSPGKVKAGKSTLLNALVGEQLAPTDAGECTRIVTWYRDGTTYAGRRCTRTPARPGRCRVRRHDGAMEIDLGGDARRGRATAVVDWPSQSLRGHTLIDTPGIGSTVDASLAADRARSSTPDDDSRPRPTPSSTSCATCTPATCAFLRGVPRPRRGPATPVNAVGGAVPGRRDRRRPARRDGLRARHRRRATGPTRPYAGSCQNVVAGRRPARRRPRGRCGRPSTPRSPRCARRHATTWRPSCCSADRFQRAGREPRLTAERAPAAAGALRPVRHPPVEHADPPRRRPTPPRSPASWSTAAGCDELEQVLHTQFAERRDVLKARSALLAVDSGCAPAMAPATARARWPARSTGPRRGARVHRAAAAQRAAQRLGHPAQPRRRRRWSGCSATPAPHRPPAWASRPARRRTRWRTPPTQRSNAGDRHTVNPMLGRATTDACRAVVRSCEGILAGLGTLA